MFQTYFGTSWWTPKVSLFNHVQSTDFDTAHKSDKDT